MDDMFKCLTCNMSGNAVRAFLPENVTNSTEYFSCNPELEVQFVDAKSLTGRVAVDGSNGTQSGSKVGGMLRQLVGVALTLRSRP